MRKRSLLTGVLLVMALSLPAIIFAQQNGSARRETNTSTRTSPSNPTNTKSPVTSAIVKVDLGEALSVIQANHVDGKKLDYNSIFKASIL